MHLIRYCTHRLGKVVLAGPVSNPKSDFSQKVLIPQTTDDIYCSAIYMFMDVKMNEQHLVYKGNPIKMHVPTRLYFPSVFKQSILVIDRKK